jgi:glyoxylase-like metal-dependent hydrolase (beta-lactamase superfamily II)
MGQNKFPITSGNSPMSENVFSLPGPFELQRIVEFEGAFTPPEHLFPDATPAEVAASAAYREPRHFDQQQNLLVMSFHSILVRTATHTILVDTCLGNDKPRPNIDIWHQRSGNYLADLASAGVTPEEVDIVMCTHLHADHVGWNTQLKDGQWVPTFPNAEYLFASKEVDHWQQELERRPADEVNHDSWADSVAPIFDAGKAVLVGSEDEITTGVRILPAPGHTPGNVMLLLEDRGERGYVLGDAIHHPIQVDYPQWSSRFCHDPDLSRKTRTQILTRAAEENAWILPAHFPTPTAARVRRTTQGFALSPP